MADESYPPSEDKMRVEAEEALMPAFILGLVEPSGPIDDEDRSRAERMLKIMETRESLAAYFRGKNAQWALKLLLGSGEARQTLDERARYDIREQIGNIRVSSHPSDIPDELWSYVEKVRKPFAEAILRGVLPQR